jgi:multiple sugar transport system substrate-binding protein
MIEEVTKSKRRAETVDDEYIDELYNEISLLYKLTGLGDSEKNQKHELGKLPGTAVALITTICTVWVVLTAYEIWQFVKKRRDIKTKP